MDIIQIAHHLDQLLDIDNIRDSSRAVNGLQVQNTGTVRKVGLEHAEAFGEYEGQQFGLETAFLDYPTGL